VDQFPSGASIAFRGAAPHPDAPMLLPSGLTEVRRVATRMRSAGLRYGGYAEVS
jgi:hypothetical protein